jgi:hypothetical protein
MRCWHDEFAAQRLHQTANVGVPCLVAQTHTLPPDEPGQLCRQLLGRREASAADEDRNDRDLPLKGVVELDANEIVGQLEPRRACIGRCCQPSGPDDR